MAQRSVFHQVIKLIPRSVFAQIVDRHRADHRVRKLDSWTWFGALLFGQLSGHYSIRAIERLSSGQRSRMQAMGFGEVRKSTLADANAHRSSDLLQDVFSYLLHRAQQLAPKFSPEMPEKVLALDSSCIPLSLKLCPWARFYKHRAAVKLHTAIDTANDLPEFAVITLGRDQDLTVAKNLRFKPGTTVVFDRGYASYRWMNQLHEQGAFFVTRLRKGFELRVLRSRKTDRTRGHICDQDVRPKNPRGQGKHYPRKFRKISYYDPDTNQKLIFLTNHFDLDVQTICDLYRDRWKVETFFKTLKQNLKIQKFLGTSENAVKTQIWVALIAYLLVQLVKLAYKANLSTPDLVAVIGTLILMKTPLSLILSDQPRITRHPPNPQLNLQI